MPYPIRIAVIGSSTAAGTGADPVELAWVNRYRAYLIAQHPENEVFNLGLGGLQTFQLLPTGDKPVRARPLPDPERNITKALSLQPHAVIVNAPSNDAAAYYGPEEQLQNFDRIIQVARAQGVPVWICTTQPRRFSPEQVQIQIRLKDAILARYGNRAINLWDSLATPDGMPKDECDAGDGAHLNNLGHRLVFESVRDSDLPASLSKAGPNLQPEKPESYLADGPTLQIHGIDSGAVTVEVYDELARLRHRYVGTLPVQIRDNFGPPGLYWVRISGKETSQMSSWIKTG